MSKEQTIIDKAIEYATGMMGIGEYSEKWHSGDKAMWQNLKRAYSQAAEVQKSLSLQTIQAKDEEIKRLREALKKVTFSSNALHTHSIATEALKQ